MSVRFPRWLTVLPAVAACAEGDAPGCEHGVAWIEGERSYASASAAAAALVDGDVLHLCAGTHDSFRTHAERSDTRYVVEGEGPDTTVVEGGADGSAAYIAGGEVTIRGVTFTGGQGTVRCDAGDEGYSDCGQPFGGAVTANGVTLVLEDVVIQGNAAHHGGGIASASSYPYSTASIVIERSRVVGNEANAGGGIALLEGTELISVDTDWGAAVDDNVGGDLAVIPGGDLPDAPTAILLERDWDGVASFRCWLSNDWEDYGCEE